MNTTDKNEILEEIYKQAQDKVTELGLKLPNVVYLRQDIYDTLRGSPYSVMPLRYTIGGELEIRLSNSEIIKVESE